jgi:hypothetical protein
VRIALPFQTIKTVNESAQVVCAFSILVSVLQLIFLGFSEIITVEFQDLHQWLPFMEKTACLVYCLGFGCDIGKL